MLSLDWRCVATVMEQQQRPLLACSEEDDSNGCRYMGKSPSMRLPPPVVTPDDVRSATPFSSSSSHYYPPSIHSALLDHAQSEDQAIVPQGRYGRPSISNDKRQVLEEAEIRKLLVEHVGGHCCWGTNPARTWKITAVEDCSVYVGILETFIEEREATEETKPFHGEKIDGKDNGTELGIWELDLTYEFPLLFVPLKETKIIVPHSEVVTKCSGCEGRGQIPCQICNAGQVHGFYKANQMTQCSVCHGRGLVAHKDGSDTLCIICNGKGLLQCTACGSRGLVECITCQGHGSMLKRKAALVKWRTLPTQKVAAARGAASVPDNIFHAAKGVELCNIQAYQCTPAYFADSFQLNKFSSEIIANRPHIPPQARLICERHVISVVPVTRVTMARKERSFSFYVIGLGQEVYIQNYPARFCWGLCCCLEWLHL